MITSTYIASSIDFQLPKDLECSKPTEVRGIARDEVRLMVSHYQDDSIQHSTFKSIGTFLRPGDVLVINTSGTLPAAISATDSRGRMLRVHLSTQKTANNWIVEVREITPQGVTKRYQQARQNEVLSLQGGGQLELINPYYQDVNLKEHLQLWMAQFQLDLPVIEYLDKYGVPIRYAYLPEPYPLTYYQTVFAQEKGSTEMPSAGRAFTDHLVTQLVAQGVGFAPILLHTGVASLELGERPYEEFYRVPDTSAQIVNLARAEGRRVIAVGTTAIRALETVTDRYGKTYGGEGWTDTFIGPQRGLYGIDGLISGFHEPKASHLLMLEALCGKRHLQKSYAAALEGQYQWHEFGDLHLLLP